MVNYLLNKILHCVDFTSIIYSYRKASPRVPKDRWSIRRVRFVKKDDWLEATHCCVFNFWVHVSARSRLFHDETRRR